MEIQSATTVVLARKGNETSASEPESFINEQIEALEDWANATQKEANRDLLLFWVLKGGAAIIAASTSVLELFGAGRVVILLGFVSAALITVDGLRPRGLLHNARLAAVFEIRDLQNLAITRWQQAQLSHAKDSLDLRQEARGILGLIDRNRRSISAKLKADEANLSVSQVRPKDDGDEPKPEDGEQGKRAEG